MNVRFFSLRQFYLASALILSGAVAGCLGGVDGGGGGDSGGGGGGGSGAGGGGAECEWGGQKYPVGETFPAGDGCNTCLCLADGSVACTEKACSGGCIYEGQLYAPGDSFPAADGCNTCECAADGIVKCTTIGCGCIYYGQVFAAGESFPAIDGCNTCTCQADGSVACTEIACACNPAKEWYRDYVSTDPMECLVISYPCPANTTSFSNSCGCGCEQSSTCPQIYDCTPPSTCNVAQLKEWCPYSVILL